MKKLVSVTAVLAVFSLIAAKADILGNWTFETSFASITGTSTALSGIAADSGSGTASGSHASAAVWSSPAGNGSSHSFSVNTWAVGDYFQFQVSTIGFQNITVAYDQASSSTGPVKFNFQYSTDGSLFTTFATDYLVLTNASSANNENTGLATAPWSSGGGQQAAYSSTWNLSSITALNNASAVYFRIVDDSSINAAGNSVPSTGTDRVDNFLVSATAVPEPSSAVLVVLGGLVGLFTLRRK